MSDKATSVGNSQWMTPDWLADEMVKLAGVWPSEAVLEPSAGHGSLVRAVLRASPTAHVTAIEKYLPNPGWAESESVKWLKEDCLRTHVSGPHRYGVCVMNPPYESGQDAEHIQWAIEQAYTVIALVRVTMMHTRRAADLVPHVSHSVRLIGRPRFNGTSGTPRHDFEILKFQQNKSGGYRSPTMSWVECK